MCRSIHAWLWSKFGMVVLGAGLVVWADTGALAAPNLVQDGSFETLGLDWNFENDGDGLVNYTLDDYRTGVSSLYFGAIASPDTVTQTISTIVNATYEISFFLKGSIPNAGQMTVKFGSTLLAEIGAGEIGTSFTKFSYQAMATSTSTVLSFSGMGDGFAGNLYLDDVSVTEAAVVPVPGPELGAGVPLALIALWGAARSRRRR